jgi:hypothetical protein
MTAAAPHSDPPAVPFSAFRLNILTSIAPQLRIGFHSDAAFHAPSEAGSEAGSVAVLRLDAVVFAPRLLCLRETPSGVGYCARGLGRSFRPMRAQ